MPVDIHFPGTLLQDYLTHTASRIPNRVALVCGQERWTYADLDRGSNAIAYTLLLAGIERGDRVIVLADNGSFPALAFWGILKADAVACIVNPATRPPKLAYYLRDLRAKALLADEGLLEEAASIVDASPHLTCFMTAGKRPISTRLRPTRLHEAMDAAPEGFCPRPRNLDLDLAAIIYTSGSTGESKGVMLTHRNMLAASSSINYYLAQREDDIIVAALPFSFDYGLYQMILAAAVGAQLMVERAFTLLPQVMIHAGNAQATVFPAVPSVFALLHALPIKPMAHIRIVTSTGDTLTPHHIATIQRVFPNAQIFSMYGLTECKRCTYLPPDDLERKPGSVGLAIPGTELWLEDDEGQRLSPTNSSGQLVIRGATVMQGYWEKLGATALCLKPGPLPGERVLHTGDLCRLDEDGYLYFLARKDDVFKSRGEKVSPREVEAVLLELPGVSEAVILGVPDTTWGHVPVAFVVLDPDTHWDEGALIAHCQSALDLPQRPSRIHITQSLPRSANGKTDRAALLERLV